MMPRKRSAFARGGVSLSSLLLVTILAACARPVATNGSISKINSVKVGDVTYPSVAAALDAIKRNNERYVDGIAVEPDPMKGSLRIVLPDRDRLRPLVLQESKQAVQGEALDFLIESRQLGDRS